jgi:photosystem II stability/assembly factor-like uncharacterized protein
MKKVCILIIVLSLFFSFLSIKPVNSNPSPNSGWSLLLSPGSETFYKVWFSSENSGCIYRGTNILKRTTNGGVNWSNGNLPQHIISTPFAFNGTYPFIGTYYDTMYGTVNYRIAELLKSTDMGLTWIYQTGDMGASNNRPRIISLEMYLNLGFFAKVNETLPTQPPYLYKTTDGGYYWGVNMNSLHYGFDPMSYFILNKIYGIDGSGYLSKSTNFGETFSTISYDVYTNVCAVDSDVVIAIGGTTLYRSTNSGTNWVITAFPVSLGSVAFPNTTTGYLTGANGKIYKSTNKGVSWGMQTTPNTDYLIGSCFINVLTGYVIGVGGTLLKTTDGGGPIIADILNVNNEIPSEYKLLQNYPNPFNPVTNIKYQIPHNSFVTLKIYDILGKEIETLENENKTPGIYNVEWFTSGYPSGVYFYKLIAGDFSEIKKMILLK